MIFGTKVKEGRKLYPDGSKVISTKNGKLLTSHRSTTYPCYLPVLGEFSRSWSYKTCRGKDKDLAGRMSGIQKLKPGLPRSVLMVDTPISWSQRSVKPL